MTIPIKTLRSLLDCNPESGELRWKRRSPEMFSVSGQLSQESCCKTWNTKNAGKLALHNIGSQGYRQGKVLDHQLQAHRVIWAITHDEWPNQIDHINGDPKDNRIINLRSVSNTENCRNRKFPVTNTSGIHGVRWCKHAGKWRAFIKVNQRLTSLGYFSEKEKAGQARRKAEIEHGFHPNHGRRP